MYNRKNAVTPLHLIKTVSYAENAVTNAVTSDINAVTFNKNRSLNLIMM